MKRMTAILTGLARRNTRRAPMEICSNGIIGVSIGLHGDFKGAKHPTRQITVMAEEDWQAALQSLPSDAADLPWTVRRANMCVRGLRLPRVKTAILAVGDVKLEVTGQTYPCRRMDEAYPGLLKALAKDWRGGVTCRVLEGGPVALGDMVSILSAPEEPPPRILPG